VLMVMSSPALRSLSEGVVAVPAVETVLV
jgi:hypothetical protein